MKILYGINTTGQGHINRSRIFIDELLKDGHEVHVLLGGAQPPEYAFQLAPRVTYRNGPLVMYNNNKLDANKTVQYYISNLGDFFRIRRELIEQDAKEDYDAFFTDFESHTSVVGRRLRKPVFAVDHQHAVLHPATAIAPGKAFDKLAYRASLSFAVPYFSHCFSIDFAYEIQTIDDITVLPLIWKPEFDNYDIVRKEHIVVYCRYDKEYVLNVLRQFPDETFFVYGYNIEEEVENMHFKKTSREGFLKDLTSAKAVIGGAGFSLTWETSLLKKLIWAIPLEAQFEQITNAYRLKQLDMAYISNDFTKEHLQKFLTWAENKNYTSDNPLPILKVSELMKQVYEVLEDQQQLRNNLTWRRMRQKINRSIAEWDLNVV